MPIDIARQKGFPDIVNALLEEEVCNTVSIYRYFDTHQPFFLHELYVQYFTSLVR